MRARQVHALKLHSGDDNGATLTLINDNRGEPYRSGVTLHVTTDDYYTLCDIFLEDREAQELRDKLNEMYPT